MNLWRRTLAGAIVDTRLPLNYRLFNLAALLEGDVTSLTEIRTRVPKSVTAEGIYHKYGVRIIYQAIAELKLFGLLTEGSSTRRLVLRGQSDDTQS